MTFFIGIDGGGTHTTAVVTDEDGHERARLEGVAGIGNVLDPEAVGHRLADLATATLSKAHIDALPRVLVCALAGAGRAPERERLERTIAAHGVAERVHVTSDFEAAVQDAFGDGCGILVVAGTGSSAFARNSEGRTARAGGWGHILGDEGSGYALGLAALRPCMREYDGRAAGESWLPMVLEHTGVASVEALVRWGAAATKADIAAQAPVVFEAAERGDATACAIIAAAADELAVHVSALHARLAPWQSVPSVALTGGLIAPGRPLREDAIHAIEKLGLGTPVLDRRIDAARGAGPRARAGPHG
jgi:N-acetylglucosamine kinase-like BadF-type ATPase